MPMFDSIEQGEIARIAKRTAKTVIDTETSFIAEIAETIGVRDNFYTDGTSAGTFVDAYADGATVTYSTFATFTTQLGTPRSRCAIRNEMSTFNTYPTSDLTYSTAFDATVTVKVNQIVNGQSFVFGAKRTHSCNATPFSDTNEGTENLIGFFVRNGNWFVGLYVENGTTCLNAGLITLDTGISALQTHQLRVIAFPIQGRAYWFVDGVLVHSYNDPQSITQPYGGFIPYFLGITLQDRYGTAATNAVAEIYSMEITRSLDKNHKHEATDVTGIVNGTMLGYVLGGGAATGTNILTGASVSTGATWVNSDDLINTTLTNGSVQAIDFDQTPSTTMQTGRLQWDPTYNTIVIGMDSNVSSELGQSIYKWVRNGSNSISITKGQVVYVSGANGTSTIEVLLADASVEATAATTIGIAAENIAPNGFGFIIIQGLLTGLDTQTYASGDLVWLSETTGAWTIIRPTAPAHGVALGWIVKVNPSVGSIYVKIVNGQELNEIHDVEISGVANRDLLQYNSSTLRWENKTLSNIGLTLSNIGQSSAETYQVPVWTGSTWAAKDLCSTDYRIETETDCNAAGEFTTISLNGGGNAFTSAGLDYNGHWGILSSTTASVANGGAGIGSGNVSDCIIFGTYQHESTAILNIPALSDATNTFYVEHGFTDNRGGVPVDGVMFSYTHSQNSGRWTCLAYNNNALTSKDSGVTVSATTWYKLRVIVFTNGSAEFYINGTLVGSTTDFPAGSCPTGSSRATANSCYIRKTVGTTTRSVQIDYYNLIIDATR